MGAICVLNGEKGSKSKAGEEEGVGS